MKWMARVLVAGAMAALVLTGLFGVGQVVNVAQAQSPTPTAPTTQPPNNTLDQAFWQAFASRLGVSLTQLTDAVKGAARDAVASQVTGGVLTQAQADEINQRIDQWQPGQGLPLGRGGRGGPGGPDGRVGLGGETVFAAVANALSMTTAELQTSLQGGQTLTALAQAKGVSTDTLKQAIVTAKKAEVDAAVQSGRLTADQATQIKQQIDQQAAAAQNLDSLLRGPGGHGGRGGFGGPGAPPSGTPPAQRTPAAMTGA